MLQRSADIHIQFGPNSASSSLFLLLCNVLEYLYSAP